MRLNKRLAELGLASRREAEVLITQGRVRVNGVEVTALGTRVGPLDRVELLPPDSGAPQGPPGFVLNKPVGYVTTKGGEEGPTIVDLLPPQAAGMAYAGRLDKDSRGLVLLLRDGRLNYALTAPQTHLEKEYLARTGAAPSSGQIEKMARGLSLSDGPTRPCRAQAEGKSGFRIWLTQGRNRQVRRMAAKVGLEVVDLARVRIGPLSLGALAEGAWRALTPAEEEALRAAVGGAGADAGALG